MLGSLSNVPDLCDGIEPATLRVYAPTDVIFLCGGQTRNNNPPPQPESLRDAFQRARYRGGGLERYTVRLAEEILPFYPQGHYQDLLSFESEVAQICELILLFSESEGSLCELGAFSMDQEISRKMLTVVRRKHYDDASFVRLGPIQSQINRYGQESVHVLSDRLLRIERPNTVADIDVAAFETAMTAAIKSRLERRGRENPEHTTFSRERPGHLIKLITGIIQHYGSMTAEEIDLILSFIGIDIPQNTISNYIVCAKFVGWITEDPVGSRILFSALPGRRAISYRIKDSFPMKSRDAWHLDVRQHWKTHDPERFTFLSQATA